MDFHPHLAALQASLTRARPATEGPQTPRQLAQQAAQGREASRLFEELARRFDALMADLTTPRPPGAGTRGPAPRASGVRPRTNAAPGP